MATLKTITFQPGCFSDWNRTIGLKYTIACCHCGLTHDFIFRAVSKKTGKPIRGDYEVEFGVKVNERSTAGVRRPLFRKGKIPIRNGSITFRREA